MNTNIKIYKNKFKIVSLCFFILGTISLFADTHYVSKTGANVSPFTTWENAANIIQDAIDVASDNDIVLVNDGIYDSGSKITPDYSSRNRIIITKNIVLKSVNGPDKTTIYGSNSELIRGVYMSAGILDGFTISKGYTRTWGDSSYDQDGAGVFMYDGGSIKNCTITFNTANIGRGGGIYGGSANNCYIGSNLAADGGGAFNSTINNSIIRYNKATVDGGGTCFGSINNSTIESNSAEDEGGGAFNSTINNSTIRNNKADSGGGLYSGTVNNCLIIVNTALQRGGGTYFGGSINNCTISRNLSELGSGGGAYKSSLNNCIIWDNWANSNSSNNIYACTICFSCTTPFANGVGNISLDPQFHPTINFKLQPTSPCINAGTNYYAPMPYDLNGNPRIVDGIVDMGAYENILPNKPYNQAPTDGAVVLVTPILQSSIFSSSDNSSTHIASQWQVSENSNFSNVIIDTGETTNNKITFAISTEELEEATYYYWHVKHKDNHEGWSDYSDETSFETVPEPFLIFHFCLLLITAYLRKQ